ncbi:anti-sigma factor [Acuticoccus sp.]|uniref:anti-sigma factor n=1 Tax=Acuticoccus sp. TaxID=1904378 RepID=UPI003B527919
MSAIDDGATDYVLGVLDEAAAAAIEARITAPANAEDRALASAVGELRDQLLELDLTAAEVEPSPGAWQRLEARLDAPQDDRSQPVAQPSSTARRPRMRRAGRTRGGVSWGWRPAAIGAAAAAALLAAVLVWQVLVPQAPAVLVVLLDDGGQPVAVLEASEDNAVLVTPLAAAETEPSEVLQLWTKPDPDGPPVSVGLLQELARMVVSNADLPRPTEGQLYEITIEPAGGSPTGLPTGPIFGVGNAQQPVLQGR